MPGGPQIQEIDDLIDSWDYTTTANTWYHGHASPGSLASAAVWRIKRITLDTSLRPTVTAMAGGNANFGNVWDNRATLTYS